MDKVAELKKRLRAIMPPSPVITLDGEVTEVENDTCSVMVGDMELVDIRLKATSNGKNSILTIPKVGSHVLMISTDGSIDNLTIVKCDEVSKFIYNENGLFIEIDSETGKIEIKNKAVSLKDLFQKSADIKKNIKVSTPMGPSGTPLPDVLLMIQDFETSFKSLLK